MHACYAAERYKKFETGGGGGGGGGRVPPLNKGKKKKKKRKTNTLKSRKPRPSILISKYPSETTQWETSDWTETTEIRLTMFMHSVSIQKAQSFDLSMRKKLRTIKYVFNALILAI